MRRVAILLTTVFFLSVVGDLLGQTEPLPLRNISKVTVTVRLSGEDVVFGVSKEQLRERLRTITELSLRTAGIRVLSDEEDAKDPDNNPFVEVNSIVFKIRNAGGVEMGYAFTCSLSVREFLKSPRNGYAAPLELWERRSLDSSNLLNGSTRLEAALKEHLDSLVNEWLRANPKH